MFSVAHPLGGTGTREAGLRGLAVALHSNRPADQKKRVDNRWQNEYSVIVGRPREFEPEAALEQAVHLFWEKGYEETSFDDIVAATKVSRYGLYGEFGNKRDLFRKALQAYFDIFAGTFQADLRRADAALPEIRGCFETMLKLGEGVAAGRGCLLCNTAIEVAPHDEEIAADVQRLFDNVTGVFRNALQNAKARGEIHPDTEVEDWAVGLTGLIQSSAMMVRMGYPLSTIRQNMRAAIAGLEKR